MDLDTPDELSERDRRDLAAHADGALSGRRAAALEARIARDPALAAAVARQRLAASTTHDRAATVSAPASLRERVETPRTAVAPRARARGPRMILVAGALIVGTFVAMLAFSGGAPDGFGVVEAAAFADRGAVEPAPPAATTTLLDRRGAGLAFPNWATRFGWRATGARTDTRDGRRLTTVYYARDAQRIAYTIVDGRPLELPTGSDSVVEGTRVRLVRSGGRALVTWQRRGHTCVLSGSADAGTLVALAGWKGKGTVAF